MKQSIVTIQQWLKKRNVDAFVVFTEDDHGSEYVVEYFKCRAYLSGFTGSAGTLVVTQDDALLWTDGRYFLQAEEQLAGSDIRLMKSGMEGVPTVREYLSRFDRVAFDFRIATTAFVNALQQTAPALRLADERTLIDSIWLDRPAMATTPAYVLGIDQVGESAQSKLDRLRQVLRDENCAYAVLGGLDDIAWLLNVRGSDIPYNPVNYAFALVSAESAVLYIDGKKLDDGTRNYLTALGVTVKPYGDVYADCASLEGTVLVDENKTNYALYATISQKKTLPFFPTTEWKAIKNATECLHTQEAHVLDGVAMVRFLHWLKENVGKIPMTEISVADKLESLRRENGACTDLSFETICGYQAHGAIVHYAATKESDIPVKAEGLLLVDSGAQYTCGTTDITRTIVLGEISDECRAHFTYVLKGHIALARAVFPQGTGGYSLDMLAREPLYRHLLDFRHGTGHGVGYILNVHEGPQRISMNACNRETSHPVVEGMVVSDEPGLYVTGKYGIRHENLELCVSAGSSEYGKFLRFHTLTLVPFDLDGIDASLLNEEERRWLNEYHARVRETLSPLLSDEDNEFLVNATREI